MSFFPADQLAWMRDEISKTMPDTCNILTKSLASNGQGGYVETWGTATASLACRIDPMVTSDSDTVVGESERVYERYVVTLPPNTSIDSEDRIEVNDYTLSVDSIDHAKSEAGCVRVYAYELSEQP